ncbi:unnamed protein product [Psylliodes chrysocephalus]|uniref:Centrosome-associated zinc finger protein CP190 n=1 Tax=Psylliodes chrysocephalus TaxID=3402493 RepID=A0A9P0GEL4_9CUCU|nr:unnamed protein product [Psylliodes chrysocephala]
MNACTEYFRFLEDNCSAMEDNTILMPSDLQSDVIVPIVNFMYTGMLEFHVSLYDKLYRVAELMNISILTKLLDAQKITPPTQPAPTPKPSKPKPEKRQPPQPRHHVELPSPLPGRKVPVWKRKNVPAASNPVQGFEKNWHTPADPLSLDNTPKPTRFEWPEDDLPTMTLLDTNFEDISYTSRPLLTKEEEEKIKPNFDDLRHNVELPTPKKGASKSGNNSVNFRDIEEFSKEQRIRTAMFEDPDEISELNQKRKADTTQLVKAPTKRIKISNKENKETMISVESSTPGDIDHTKIVTEILKKYPDLVKKNKNIKLKIMPGSKDTSEKKIVNAVVEQVRRSPVQPEPVKTRPPPLQQFQGKRKNKIETVLDDEGPWVCKKCVSMGGEVQEFVLYYLYRKHMTDMHDEVFDARLCKYCGHKCGNHNLMMYHMYTKHALKPPSAYNFPSCEKCPYVALNVDRLNKHVLLHYPNEIQCQDCKLAFASTPALSAHIRMTGHYNKPGRVSYDCQYCMKKLQSAITLMSHIRKAHLSEGKRDGIVCLEELDTLEDLEEVDDEDQQFIVPEMLSDTLHKDKVKIISNVTVPPNRREADGAQQNRLVQLDASSEAEALNNVATGLATSLNLVDIVVLDDNQQYILQQDGGSERKFIIPELGHGQSFSGQVISTQDNTVIQQGMIQSSTGDIASTDELVMVLTDHDYPDEQEGENPENSNIVVLYSHPVEGQEGQFITSQGNLMVNSQTGMLEIRNGPTIATTTASQMVVTNSVDSPIESIEMIQREIESQGSQLKHEPFFSEERKQEEMHAEQHTTKLQSMPDISETEVQEIPVDNEPENAAQTEDEQQIEETEEHCQVQTDDSLNESAEQQHEAKDTSEDNVDGSLDVSNEEPMDIDDMEHKTAENEEMDESISQENLEEEHQPQEAETSISDQPAPEEEKECPGPESADIPPERESPTSPSEAVDLNNFSVDKDDAEKLPMIAEESEEQQEPESQEEPIDQGEPMEVDGKVVEEEGDAKEDPEELAENNETDNGVDESQVTDDADNQLLQEEPQGEESEKNVEVSSLQETPSQSIPPKNATDINRTILDDWEDDTDSQQSDKNVDRDSEVLDADENNKEPIVNTAVDNVNKLMDDWDEEEEEERKE